jgi:hypothetical protein
VFCHEQSLSLSLFEQVSRLASLVLERVQDASAEEEGEYEEEGGEEY